MGEEFKDHLILHWNYQGYSSLPTELQKFENRVDELYLKFNNIKQLVKYLFNTNIFISDYKFWSQFCSLIGYNR